MTHQEYSSGIFMTIPEAVSLVFLAGAMAKGGEVMVLDMGEPVKIYDFAQRLITYFGDGRSKVVVTGLRPGERSCMRSCLPTRTRRCPPTTRRCSRRR